MDQGYSFTVKNRPEGSRLCIIVLSIMAIISLGFFIFSPNTNKALFVLVIVLIFIPGILVALWLKTYRVTVNGRRIAVRKQFGLKRFDLDISDIAKVRWITTNIVTGRNDNITVFTPGGESFKI